MHPIRLRLWCALTVALAVGIPYASATTVAWWQFNEGTGTTAADASGHGHTATLMGGAGWSSSTPSGSGYSLQLSGDGWAQIPDTPELRLLDVAFRVEASVNLNSYGDTWTSVLSKRKTTGDRPGWMLLVGGSNHAQADVRGHLAFVINGGSATRKVYGSIAVPQGEWAHLAAEFCPATQQVRLFVNGQEDVLASLGSEITDSGLSSLWIGADAAGGYGLDGSIDDVRISVIPEPVTGLALLTSLIGLGRYVRRRVKA